MKKALSFILTLTAVVVTATAISGIGRAQDGDWPLEPIPDEDLQIEIDRDNLESNIESENIPLDECDLADLEVVSMTVLYLEEAGWWTDGPQFYGFWRPDYHGEKAAWLGPKLGVEVTIANNGSRGAVSYLDVHVGAWDSTMLGERVARVDFELGPNRTKTFFVPLFSAVNPSYPRLQTPNYLGWWWIDIVVDAPDYVAECNESNNWLGQLVDIQDMDWMDPEKDIWENQDAWLGADHSWLWSDVRTYDNYPEDVWFWVVEEVPIVTD